MSWGYIGSAAVIAIGSAVSADKQAKASREAAATQQASIEAGIARTDVATTAGQEFLTPAAQAGQLGLEQAGFLTDPQAQFDFLQNNPLFQMSLEQAGTETKQLAAARGRLSAGDTLQQLSENVLLSAQPLVAQQKASISDLINLASGTGVAQANVEIGAGTNVTDLLTSSGDVGAAGIIGASKAQAAGTKAGTEAVASIIPKIAGRT